MVFRYKGPFIETDGMGVFQYPDAFHIENLSLDENILLSESGNPIMTENGEYIEMDKGDNK